MKKITLHRETIRQLGEETLAHVQGGTISAGVNCHVSRSCYTRMGCRTEDIC